MCYHDHDFLKEIILKLQSLKDEKAFFEKEEARSCSDSLAMLLYNEDLNLTDYEFKSIYNLSIALADFNMTNTLRKKEGYKFDEYWTTQDFLENEKFIVDVYLKVSQQTQLLNEIVCCTYDFIKSKARKIIKKFNSAKRHPTHTIRYLKSLTKEDIDKLKSFVFNLRKQPCLSNDFCYIHEDHLGSYIKIRNFFMYDFDDIKNYINENYSAIENEIESQKARWYTMRESHSDIKEMISIVINILNSRCT